MATPSTATRNYSLSLLLTPSLIQTLSRSNLGGMRNVARFEVTPRATSQGQPVTSKTAKLHAQIPRARARTAVLSVSATGL